MQQFKVGDLVNVQSNSNRTLANIGRAVNFTGKIVAIHQYNGICVHPLNGNPIEGDWYSPEELSTWQPKEGEWCWFYNLCNPQVTPVLAQFDYMSDNIYVTKAIELPLSGQGPYPYGFNNCIPFIGTLPDIPKDTQ